MDFRDEKKEALIKAYREQAGIKQFLIFFLLKYFFDFAKKYPKFYSKGRNGKGRKVLL